MPSVPISEAAVYQRLLRVLPDDLEGNPMVVFGQDHLSVVVQQHHVHFDGSNFTRYGDHLMIQIHENAPPFRAAPADDLHTI